MSKPVRISLPKALGAGVTTFVFFLTACGGGGGGGAPPPSPPAPVPTPTPTATPTPAPSSTEREIAPNAANPVLSASDAANFTITPDPAASARGKLFVMLPGTGAIPRNYRSIVRIGAGRGYYGIGLTYPNPVAVADLCVASSDPGCIGKTRREIITGENTSPVVEIDPANSIAGRLYALLGYMDRTYPLEGWGRFIAGGTIDWSLVTLAGHSQGAGHAGYSAKLFSLDRVAMFSGPGDVPVAGGAPNPWLTLPNVTPASRQYAFTHSEDETGALRAASLELDRDGADDAQWHPGIGRRRFAALSRFAPVGDCRCAEPDRREHDCLAQARFAGGRRDHPHHDRRRIPLYPGLGLHGLSVTAVTS